MKTFTLALLSVAAMGLSLSTPLKSEAHNRHFFIFADHAFHDDIYKLVCRRRHDDEWDTIGKFRFRSDAENRRDDLERDGRFCRIERL